VHACITDLQRFYRCVFCRIRKWFTVSYSILKFLTMSVFNFEFQSIKYIRITTVQWTSSFQEDMHVQSIWKLNAFAESWIDRLSKTWQNTRNFSVIWYLLVYVSRYIFCWIMVKLIHIQDLKPGHTTKRYDNFFSPLVNDAGQQLLVLELLKSAYW
jgi:hypothetical protein